MAKTVYMAEAYMAEKPNDRAGWNGTAVAGDQLQTSKEGTIHVAEMSKALAVITDDNNQYEKLIKISIGDLLEEKHIEVPDEWKYDKSIFVDEDENT